MIKLMKAIISTCSNGLNWLKYQNNKEKKESIDESKKTRVYFVFSARRSPPAARNVAPTWINW